MTPDLEVTLLANALDALNGKWPRVRIAEEISVPPPGYCRHPERCAGLSSCPRNPTCID